MEWDAGEKRRTVMAETDRAGKTIGQPVVNRVVEEIKLPEAEKKRYSRGRRNRWGHVYQKSRYWSRQPLI